MNKTTVCAEYVATDKTEAPMVVNMATEEGTMDNGPPPQTEISEMKFEGVTPYDSNGTSSTSQSASASALSSLLPSSQRPDSANLDDDWCIVSETALTKEMLQHLSKPDEIGSLAASYLTRGLFRTLENALIPTLVDEIFKALQHVSEIDEEVLRSFIAEFNDELDNQAGPRRSSSLSNDNEENDHQQHCPKAVVKVLLNLLRFSPVPVEHNILWIRLLSLLSHSRSPMTFIDLITFIDLKVGATVLGTMTVHVSSAEIQEYGCCVLEPLAKFKPTPERKAPVRESGIQVILRALDAHVDNEPIVEAVCRVLANLSSTMSQFTSWAVQQGYHEDEAEKLVGTALDITDYIKENALIVLDKAMMIYPDNGNIQTEGFKIMACFGYFSRDLSSGEPSPIIYTGHRKQSILKSHDSPRSTGPHRRVTFSYELDTKVEYQCSDSDSDIDEPKRHTVCGGETTPSGEALFLETVYHQSQEKKRTVSDEDNRLSFPNFKMDDNYLQMWLHILGEGPFSSICCDLARLERDFVKTDDSSSSQNSSSEAIDIPASPVVNASSLVCHSSSYPPQKQSVEGPSNSLPTRYELIRPERGAAANRYATVPGYRHDFRQPDWQVRDTDSEVRNLLQSKQIGSPKINAKRTLSLPTRVEEQPGEDITALSVDLPNECLEFADDNTFTEYSELDLIEALVRTGMEMHQDKPPTNEDSHSDEAELENKGNEEREKLHSDHSADCTLISGVTSDDSTVDDIEPRNTDTNRNDVRTEGMSTFDNILPIDKYLEQRFNLSEDILNKFGVHHNNGTIPLAEVSSGCCNSDDVFLDDNTTSDEYYKSTNRNGDLLDYEYQHSGQESTQQAFTDAIQSLRHVPGSFHTFLTSSPTSSVSSASMSLAEWSDLEALYEEEESVTSIDTMMIEDTSPNSETEMTHQSSHTMPKQRKINLMHRLSERSPQNFPPPKPRRTWYYRSSADVRKSIIKSLGADVDSFIGGSDFSYPSPSNASNRDCRKSLLAFSKSNVNVSCDSGVVTGDDEEYLNVSNRNSYPVGHDYEEVYMSKAELKPTLYERISKKGHYAEVKKATKASLQEDSSPEATYNVCTLWVNNNCVEALVTFDHLTKQLVSPYSIVPAVRQLEETRNMSPGADAKSVIGEQDYPVWTSILNVLATEESKWTLSLAAQVLPIIDRLFYIKDEAIMDASVGLVQVLIKKFGYEVEKHHSGGLFRTRFRDDCRTCFLWLSKLYSRVSDLLKRDSRRDEDLDSLLHLSLLDALREALKPFNGRFSRGLAL